jgi:hypothetical protein
MSQLLDLLPVLNVLIVPVSVFIVRIDRRLGQLDVLHASALDQMSKLEAKVIKMEEKQFQLAMASGHAAG